MTYSVRGKNILITGAAMGMGRLYAHLAADEGANIITLWDINAEALNKTAEEIRKKGAKVFTDVVDLSKEEEINNAVKKFKKSEDSSLDILINNAGIVPNNNYFWDNDVYKDIWLTMSINGLAPMYLTKALIVDMIADKSREKRILNVASAAGTVSNPNLAVYCSSKWAALGWSDSLRLELIKSGNTHIKLTTFCPTYISTGMFEGAKGLLLTPVMTPEKAVDIAWNAMKKGTPIQYTPWTTRFAMFLRGVLPTKAWDWCANHVLKIYSSMDEFKGRN